MSSGAAWLLPSERIRELRDRLTRAGSVRVVDTAELFGVSTETVRRDLKVLARDGIADLVRGGARLKGDLAPGVPKSLPPVDQRSDTCRAEKDAIARCAAGLVRDGQVVLLDGGTTAAVLAMRLRPRRGLTVVTNNLLVVSELAHCHGWRIHVIGGELSGPSMSLVGLAAIRGLKDAAVDIAFLGAAGISVHHGFTSADPVEAELKRGMMEIARRVVVIADHTKLQTSGFSTFATPADVDTFVTSKGADEADLEPLRAAGVRIVIAE